MAIINITTNITPIKRAIPKSAITAGRSAVGNAPIIVIITIITINDPRQLSSAKVSPQINILYIYIFYDYL